MKATELKDLEVEKIAFVDEGDNPEADIAVTKRRSDGVSGFCERLAKAFERLFKIAEDEDGGGDDGGNDDDNADDDVDDDDNDNNGGGEDVDKNAGTGDAADKADESRKVSEKKMAIDLTKLTTEELGAISEMFSKAFAPEKEDIPEDAKKSAPEDTNKGAEDASKDVYKGLSDEIKAELDALKKRANEAEEREMMSVAKKYEILGKKPEELAVTLKSLKDAGGNLYDDMIAMLDASKAAVEKAGTFGELGKSGGTGTSGADAAWAKIEKHAEELKKASPNLTKAEAIDKAAAEHPELVAEYEQARD